MLHEAVMALARMLRHPKQEPLHVRRHLKQKAVGRSVIDADSYYFVAGENPASTGIKDVERACVHAGEPYGNKQTKRRETRKRQAARGSDVLERKEVLDGYTSGILERRQTPRWWQYNI
jgi:hypothetical protein